MALVLGIVLRYPTLWQCRKPHAARLVAMSSFPPVRLLLIEFLLVSINFVLSIFFNLTFGNTAPCCVISRVEKQTKNNVHVYKREIGSFVTTLSFTYYYDHQATDGSKTGSQNIRGSTVENSEGYHRRRVS